MTASTRRVVRAAGLAAAGLPLVIAGRAYADPVNGQSEDTGAEPDANPHRYCFASSMQAMAQDNIDDTFFTTDGNSDMNRQFDSSCDRSGSSQTDTDWRDVNLPDEGRGLTDCAVYFENDTCDRNIVSMDLSEIIEDSMEAGAGSYENNFTKTACHETGHTMGLTHYKDADGDFPSAPEDQDDCMVSGVVNNNVTWRVYSDHHKGHINDNF